jgi:membrane protein YqaA with SNARE-associated domain
METAIAAVAGELVSWFISFAFNRFWSSSKYEGLEEKRERLRHLVTSAHTVAEEADARYITNSGMLMQVKEHFLVMVSDSNMS